MGSNLRKRQLSECSFSEKIKLLISDKRMKENVPPELTDLNCTIDSTKSLEDNTCDNEHKITTPKKYHQNFEDPVTPNTNFKLLTSLAATLDYANCSTPKSNRRSEVFDGQLYDFDVPDTAVKINRKEKSLAIICTRFLSMFPIYPLPNQKIIVSLDDACVKLGVERRRLYDIVNVFESIDMLSKNAKNQYLWFGKNNIFSSLLKLKETAIKENMFEKLQYVLKSECIPNCRQSCMLSEVENFNKTLDSPDSFPFSAQATALELRKEKSLGIMSQKFLMLFLVSPNKVISLGVAAKVLNGFLHRNEKAAQVKTQIRRLYDIANVLSSIGLIRKEVALIPHGRKPAFKYIGPDLQNAKDDFSLNTSNNKSAVKSRSLARHSSFQEICAVAEIERQKLTVKESPNSAPPFDTTSTIQQENLKTNFKNLAFNGKTSEINTNAVQAKKIKISPSVSKQPPVKVLRSSASTTVPCYVLNNFLPSKCEGKYPNSSGNQTVLLLGPVVSPKEIKAENAASQAPINGFNSQTVILSSEQRDAILHSLNISLSSEQFASIYLDGDAQSSGHSNLHANVLKIINKNSINKPLEHKITNTFSAKSLELVVGGTTSTSNTGNNSPSSMQTVDSPLSIPSGYVTPIPTAASDMSFVSNTEVNDILKKIENQQNVNSTCNINGSNSNLHNLEVFQSSAECFDSIGYMRSDADSLQNADLKRKKINNQSSLPSDINRKTNCIPNQLISNDSCSNDSINLEVSNIFKGKNLGENSPKPKPFLIDEKTILSPLKKTNIMFEGTVLPNVITPPHIIPDTLFVFNTPSVSYQATKIGNTSNTATVIIPTSVTDKMKQVFSTTQT